MDRQLPTDAAIEEINAACPSGCSAHVYGLETNQVTVRLLKLAEDEGDPKVAAEAVYDKSQKVIGIDVKEKAKENYEWVYRTIITFLDYLNEGKEETAETEET